MQVIDDPATNQLYLVQEYCKMGNIMSEAEFNEPLPPNVTRSYFRDIVHGLEYLHFQRVMHRDLKPSNILVSESGVAKIGDFGVSIMLRSDDDTMTDVGGTPAFMAPELFAEHPRFSGKAADIWALGATLYNLAVGRPPFMANTEMELVTKLTSMAEKDEPSYPADMSPQLKYVTLVHACVC
ncbi:hypothetical protein EON66_08330 [archaeon]|nr:MAG: hypothetical protein EON66_08330 [archaeon]